MLGRQSPVRFHTWSKAPFLKDILICLVMVASVSCNRDQKDIFTVLPTINQIKIIERAPLAIDHTVSALPLEVHDWKDGIAQLEVDRILDMEQQTVRAETRGDFEAAEAIAGQWLEKLRDLLPEEHWKTAEVNAYRESLRFRSGLSSVERESLIYLKYLEGLLAVADDSRTTIEKGEAILTGRGIVLSADDEEIARLKLSLATHHDLVGSRERAVTLAQEAYDSRSRRLGATHPLALHTLGVLASFQSDAKKGEQAFVQLSNELGPGHPSCGEAAHALSVTLLNQRQLAAAEVYAYQALAITKHHHGEDSSLTAESINGLASIVSKSGDQQQAVQLFELALKNYRVVEKSDSRKFNLCRVNKGVAHLERGDMDIARSLFESVLRDAHPQDFDLRARAESGLGFVSYKSGDLQSALDGYSRSGVAYHERYGINHPDAIRTQIMVGSLLTTQGRYEDASQLLLGVVERSREILGANHSSTVRAYHAAALNAWYQGNTNDAIELARNAANGFMSLREDTSADGFERSDYAKRHSPLTLLAILCCQLDRPEDAWKWYEQELGRGLLDEMYFRRALGIPAAERSRQDELLSELQVIENQSAALFSLAQSDPNFQSQLEQTLERRDDLEHNLRTLRLQLGEEYGIRGGESLPRERIQAQIPTDTALVAWLDLPTDDGWRAFALTLTSQSVHVIRLPAVKSELSGEGADFTSRLRAACVDRSRSDEYRILVQEARQSRLEPVLHRLADEGLDIHRFVILPSNVFKDLPLQVLDDDLVFTRAPSGSVYAWLRENTRKDIPRKVLAVGDPDYAIPPPLTDWLGSTLPRISGSGREARAVGTHFQEGTVLLRSAACEQMIRSLAASGELTEFSHLHFATHVSINDESPFASSIRLACDSLPGLISDILANRPVTDGSVSAAEILNQWELDAEVVVLSGCSSALGKSVGGEGQVGFAQAILLAGARNVVVTQWNIDDYASELLMAKFHELLASDGTSPSRALWLAQRWLRQASPRDIQGASNNRSDESDLPPKLRNTVNKQHPFAHPYYWAAFTLVGAD